MMGRQFSFYLTQSDLSRLEESLSETEALSIVGEESPNSVPLSVPGLKIGRMGRDNLTVYIVRHKDLRQIRFESVENTNSWFVDVLLSPVIEVSRCYRRGKILRRGRMYYTTGYYLDDSTWRDKDADFLRWAAKIFSVAKKSLIRVRSLDAYLGSEAKELLDKGAVEFSEG